LSCEYLDLSGTPTVNFVDNRDSEPESIPEDINVLYCNMNQEFSGWIQRFSHGWMLIKGKKT
jgi:hypothetical protein